MQMKLVENSSWSYAAKLSATALFFAADILIARALHVDQYAEWAFFYAILSMVYYFFWFGVNGSAKVFVSKALPSPEKRALYIQAGARVRALTTLALMLLFGGLVLLAPAFPFFRELCRQYPHLQTLLLLSPGIAGLNSFVEFFKENEIGVQDYRAVFLLTTLEYAMIAAAGALGAALSRSAEGVGLGYLAAYAVTALLGGIGVKRWNGIRSFRSRSPECRRCAGQIFRYAVPLALIGIGGIVLVEMDTFMLGIMGAPEQVSDYAIAKQICTKASHINNALAMGTMTSFSVITAENYAEKRRSFSRVTGINLLVTLTAGCALFLLSDFAIGLLYGEKYAGAGRIVRFLTPYYLLYGLSAYFALFLDFHGKAGKRSLWYLIMVGINFVLNLLLIPPYGPEGACMATVISLIPYTVFLVYATYRQVWKEHQTLYEKD